MDKQLLLETAMQLNSVSSSAAEEYHQKMDQLIVQMNTLMLEKPDIERIVGEDNLGMMKDNHANHARFMASVFNNYNTEVLVETVLWVFRAYQSHGFSSNYWATQLNTWIYLLKEELTAESYSEIYPYYAWMQVNIPVFVAISDEKLDASKSLH